MFFKEQTSYKIFYDFFAGEKLNIVIRIFFLFIFLINLFKVCAGCG